MNCPNCRQPSGAERNYCGGCGAALARFCARCGFRNLVADQYCGGCGAPLDGGGAPAARAEAGRGEGRPLPGEASAAADDLAELLATAREGESPQASDPTARVSQDDIDSLFGD